MSPSHLFLTFQQLLSQPLRVCLSCHKYCRKTQIVSILQAISIIGLTIFSMLFDAKQSDAQNYQAIFNSGHSQTGKLHQAESRDQLSSQNDSEYVNPNRLTALKPAVWEETDDFDAAPTPFQPLPAQPLKPQDRSTLSPNSSKELQHNNFDGNPAHPGNNSSESARPGTFPQFTGFDNQWVNYEIEPSSTPANSPTNKFPEGLEGWIDRAVVLANYAGSWVNSKLAFHRKTLDGDGGFNQPVRLDLKRIFGSLTIVIAGYLALVWLLRFLQPQAGRPLPTDAIEVLGKTPFRQKESLQLVRLGHRLLLLLESENGVQPLTEVTDPYEVESLLAVVQPARRRIQRSRSSSTTKQIGNAKNLANRLSAPIETYEDPTHSPTHSPTQSNQSKPNLINRNLVQGHFNAGNQNANNQGLQQLLHSIEVAARQAQANHRTNYEA